MRGLPREGAHPPFVGRPDTTGERVVNTSNNAGTEDFVLPNSDTALLATGKEPESVSERQALLLEIQTLREQLTAERKARASLETRMSREIALAEKGVQGHLSYRLGKEIVASGSSPLSWASLPHRLLGAYRKFRQERGERNGRRTDRAPPALVTLYEQEGVVGLTRHFRQNKASISGRELAAELIQAGRALTRAGVESAELALTAKAVELDPGTSTLRAHFWACHRAADYGAAYEAAERLWRLATEQSLSLTEQERLGKIFRHPVRQLSILNLAQEASSRAFDPLPNRLCYVLHNSLPHSSGGYATRSHGLASALTSAGWDVVAVTRPGFPFDVAADLSPDKVRLEDQVDQVRYIRLFEPSRRGLGPTQYISLAADAIEAELRRQRPEVVVGASNHLTGLPTLIAARRLGIPFFYEVRGLWEVTRLSREPEFAKNINYWLQRELEAALAKNADGVFTLTEAMREELQERGVPPEKISLLPNSCDAETFAPREKDRKLLEQLGVPEDVPVIGYVGTFVTYEGLDDLALAAGLLKRRGARFRLLLVGNEDASGNGRGAITDAIEKHARQEGFLDWLIMPGRIPHELVPRYYSLIDITPFPRKPLPVCEMVSPIKPLEALAMGKAVLVSDVRALAEMVRSGETGLLFRKGEVNDLADKLALLLKNRALRERLGQRGRQWVKQERSWQRAAERMSAKIAEHRRPAAG